MISVSKGVLPASQANWNVQNKLEIGNKNKPPARTRYMAFEWNVAEQEKTDMCFFIYFVLVLKKYCQERDSCL